MKKHIHPCSGKTHWFSQIGPSAPYAFALAVALALGNIVAFAQISIPNTSFTYTENFNTLPISGTGHTAVPAGWAFFETLVGYSGANTYRAGDASGDYWQQTYDTYSLGATGTSDRAFGSITSTGQDSLNTTIGVCFTNNTGAPITSLTVTYTGETWRVASPNRVDGLVFQYNQNTTAINGLGTWTAFSALNYFNPGAPTEVGGSIQHSEMVSATISSLNIAPGNTFCFRWLNFNATAAAFGNPNQEDALGVDDFSLGNIVACDPPTITLPAVTQPTCATPTGTIVVNATGSGALEYSINNGSTWQSTNTYGGQAPGNYNIKVRLQANPSCEATYGSNPVVLTSPFTVSTTTDTWTGCVSTNWATPGNWVDGSVPTAADDVTIPDVANDPVIMGGTAAVAKSVLVQASAVFTIQATGSLAINGATGFALENFGILDNSGTIRVGNISTVANIGIVHRSGGTLNNKPNGLIQIDRTGGAEAFYTSGVVNNEATINIGINATVSGNGISVDGGTFNNNLGGSIQIEQTTGNGVFTGGNGGVFNNNATGSIRINRISGIGVMNFSTFYNAGTLTIGDIAFSGQDDIENYATFTNASTGIISVDRAFSNGIWHITGTFQNSGKITVGSIANTGTGILSYVPFTNSAGAEIHIDRAPNGIVSTNAFTNAGLIRMGENAPLTGSGIVNTGATAVLNNNAGGDISIKQTAVNGVQNDLNSTFNNNACATLTIFDNLSNSGSFTNAGLFTVNTTQTHTNSALTNNGIIAYPQGNPIPNVTNNEIVIAPTTANDCDVISPAFALGSPVDFTIMGIFTDEAATMSAGTYVTATNTFTPTTILAEGAYTFYVKIADNNGGCTRIIPWQLTTQNCCPATGAIWYVNAAAAPGGNGASWECAFQDLQLAIAAASSGHQIWVAAGTYKPTSGADRNISFSMKDGVAIYGGFPGLPGQEGNFGVRDWVANVTTLSGEIGAAGMADNTFNIVRNGAMSSTAILDGFQIAFGNASGGNDRGGALHNEANASPTIRNCTFLSNLGGYGGAVYSFTSCTPTFTNCTFIGNQGNAWGTLFTEGSSFYTFINCSFSGNMGNPGVIYSNGMPAVLKNCIIWGNGTQAIAGQATINNSIIEGGYTGAGNLNLNPLFVSQPPVGLGTTGDLSLQICSPAIDAGNDSDNNTPLDLGGTPRKFESILYGQMIDMGAYEYQSSSRPGDPAVFGNNIWNAYVWRSGGASLPNSSAWNDLYSGYYVENNLSINTEARWPASGAPSQASGYQGCPVDNDNHSYSYKRKGFPAAYYQLNIDGHDDAAQLWINGTNVWEHSGCCDAHVNVWAGNLGATDEVEFRVTEGAGGSLGKLSIIQCPTGNVLYVNADASGANNGSSWTDAFTDLQSALNSTCFGVTEIWVAEGTYKPTSGTDRNISFVMKNGVGIYGGFNGTETMRAQRNWALNSTTLSGDIGTAGNNSDNSYHVILNNNNGLSNTTVLDGFTITGGNANGGSTASYGGGMYNINASPTIANCNFTQNSASFSGGAVYQGGTYNSSFTGCQFDANSAPFGGALSSSGFAPSAGTTRLTNCHFTNNTATNGGGAINNGFSNTTGTSLCVFTNCTFLNNICHNGSTIGTGGAYQSQFVGFNADFINCAFNGNKALGTADDGGGAIMVYGGTVTLVNSMITNSQSAGNGGAISTFGTNSVAVLKNTILWNNQSFTASIFNNNGGSTNAEYSLLQESACPPNTTCGAGMIYNKNPLFVSAADLRLQACSPAVNTGSNAAVPGGVTTDLDNNPRIFGGTVDMGAYELQAAPTPIVPVCQNQTVFLNNMGMATFSPALLSNGTTGCGTLLYTVGGQSTLNFTCADIGAPIPVTLTVTDDRGITATCSATITVADNTAPSITCPATQTLALGANCTAALPNYTSLATTGDNCGVQSVTQSPAAGTVVSSAGDMTVTLTVTDINGLTNFCTFTVTKVDNTPPSITCPATQTLALGANCTAALPNYTSLATTGDNCGVQGVTQSPAAGTTVSSAGDMTVTLTVTDINGLTNTCTFTVTKVDNTPASITCPATQTLVLGSSCTATLPNYTSLAATGDNCGVQGVTQSPAAGTVVSSAGNMTVTLTVTDINGLTNTCTFTVTKVDNTAPTITCPATQTLVLGSSCTAALPNYTSLAATGDNCGVQSVTQSPAAGTVVSSAGNMTVTLTVTDINGLTNTCTFTVTKVDNTPPTVQCFNQTLNFNGEESIELDADDLAEASDNCGVQSISLSPSSISAERVGQIVPVTVTVTDINGNVATCTAQITVSGFPAGWSQQPGGAGCSGNNNNYNSGTGVWTATSTNCFYGPPYTSDATSFVQRTLCGDGSLTAQVTSISGSALGWAGIVMRESNAPGAKKAQLMTNLSSLHRREFRTTTNGAAQPQQSASNGRYWLRITRTGNQFTMSVSANGTSWFLIGAQNIVMSNCIQMGLVATNYTANSTVTATFAGVSYTGSNAGLGSGGIGQRAESREGLHSFEVYPNPTSGELNLDLTQYIGQSIRIETYSLEGKLLQFSEIEEVQATVEQLNLKSLSGGMYLVKLKSAGLPDATRRIVVNRN